MNNFKSICLDLKDDPIIFEPTKLNQQLPNQETNMGRKANPNAYLIIRGLIF